MGALNLPSAADLERLTRRVRSVAQRLEGIEDGVDRLSDRVGGSGDVRLERLEQRLAALDASIASIADSVGRARPHGGAGGRGKPAAKPPSGQGRAREGGAANQRGQDAGRVLLKPARAAQLAPSAASAAAPRRSETSSSRSPSIRSPPPASPSLTARMHAARTPCPAATVSTVAASISTASAPSARHCSAPGRVRVVEEIGRDDGSGMVGASGERSCQRRVRQHARA